MTGAEAQSALVETLVRWSVGEETAVEVVRSAALAVADGALDDWVMALASLSAGATETDIEDVLEATPAQFGVQLVPRGNPQALLAATVVMARWCVDGRLAEREFARWAHSVIGHGRSSELEPLVRLDDDYDTVEYSADTIESVDRRVRAEAQRLAALPMPG